MLPDQESTPKQKHQKVRCQNFIKKSIKVKGDSRFVTLEKPIFNLIRGCSWIF